MVYYIDTNVFLYLFEANEEFGPAAKKIFEHIENGDEKAVTSALTPIQIDWVLSEIATETEYDFNNIFSKIRALKHLTIVPLTEEIIASAENAKKKYPTLDTEDAVHYATAEKYGCDIICSNDRDFDNTNIKRYFA